MLKASLTELSFVAFDIETTGMDPHRHRIVELAAIRFDLARHVHQTFESLLDPQRAIPIATSRIHGITSEAIKGKPTVAQILPLFREWMEPSETVLVAHNARFDLVFLESAYRSVRCRPFDNRVIDTLTMARSRLPNQRSYSLQCLSARLGIKRLGISHRALSDAFLAMEVFISLVLATPRLSDMSELINVTRPVAMGASI